MCDFTPVMVLLRHFRTFGYDERITNISDKQI